MRFRGKGEVKQEIVFLEIWTNGSLTIKEALYEVFLDFIDLVTVAMLFMFIVRM